jgi:hypothetical protein
MNQNFPAPVNTRLLQVWNPFQLTLLYLYPGIIVEITLFSNVFIVLSAFLYFQSYIRHVSCQIAFKFKLTLSKML